MEKKNKITIKRKVDHYFEIVIEKSFTIMKGEDQCYIKIY